jgi:hypothetical protein
MRDSLEVGVYYSPTKRIPSETYYPSGEMNKSDEIFTVYNSDAILDSVRKKFKEEEIDYVIDYLHFTDSLNIKTGEAIIDKFTFLNYFSKREIGDNDIYILNYSPLGIIGLELKIVGFSETSGIFTPKSSFKRALLEIVILTFLQIMIFIKIQV